MSAFLPQWPYHYGQVYFETIPITRFSVSTHYIGISKKFLEELSRAETGAAAWLRRMELLRMPPYTPLVFAGRAQLAHRRHELAPLPRGRVKRWRSLKEKRIAWGTA